MRPAGGEHSRMAIIRLICRPKSLESLLLDLQEVILNSLRIEQDLDTIPTAERCCPTFITMPPMTNGVSSSRGEDVELAIKTDVPQDPANVPNP